MLKVLVDAITSMHTIQEIQVIAPKRQVYTGAPLRGPDLHMDLDIVHRSWQLQLIDIRISAAVAIDVDRTCISAPIVRPRNALTLSVRVVAHMHSKSLHICACIGTRVSDA
jgi:hypothetical protein